MCDQQACCVLCICCDDADPAKVVAALAGEFRIWLPALSEAQSVEIAGAYLAHYDVAGKGWLEAMLADIRRMIHMRPRLKGLDG